MVFDIKKKCPECGSKAVRLYQSKTINGIRKWIPTAWFCTDCNYVYTIASDTLMYSLGGDEYKKRYHSKCPKCDYRLKRIYRHKNPVHGKQKWISIAWYCGRCKYVWMDTKSYNK
jgi:C4-type Zn-finger protein